MAASRERAAPFRFCSRRARAQGKVGHPSPVARPPQRRKGRMNGILYRIAFTIARYVAIETNDGTPLHRNDSAREPLQSLGGERDGPPTLRRPRRRGAACRGAPRRDAGREA